MTSRAESFNRHETSNVPTLLKMATIALKQTELWKVVDARISEVADTSLLELLGGKQESSSSQASCSSTDAHREGLVQRRIQHYDPNRSNNAALSKIGLSSTGSIRDHILHKELDDIFGMAFPVTVIEELSHPLVKSYARNIHAQIGQVAKFSLASDTERSSLEYRLRYEISNGRDAADNEIIQHALVEAGGSILDMPPCCLHLMGARLPSIRVLDLTSVSIETGRFEELLGVFSFLEELHLNTGICLARSGHSKSEPKYFRGVTPDQLDLIPRYLKRLKRLHLKLLPEDLRVPAKMRDNALMALTKQVDFANSLEQLRLSDVPFTLDLAESLTRCSGVQGLHINCLRADSSTSFIGVLQALQAMIVGDSAWKKLRWLSIEDVDGVNGKLSTGEKEVFQAWLRQLIRNNPDISELRLPLDCELISTAILDECRYRLPQLKILDLYNKSHPINHSDETTEALTRLLQKAPIQWLSIAERGLKKLIRDNAPKLRYLQSKVSLGVGQLSARASNFEEVNLLMPARFAPDAALKFMRISLPRVNNDGSAAASVQRLNGLVKQLEEVQRGDAYYRFWRLLGEHLEGVFANWAQVPNMDARPFAQILPVLKTAAAMELYHDRMRQMGPELNKLQALKRWEVLDARESTINRQIVENTASSSSSGNELAAIEAEKADLLRVMDNVEHCQELRKRLTDKYGEAHLDQWIAAINDHAPTLEEARLSVGLASMQQLMDIVKKLRLDALLARAKLQGKEFADWLNATGQVSAQDVEHCFSGISRLQSLGQQATAEEIETVLLDLQALLKQLKEPQWESEKFFERLQMAPGEAELRQALAAVRKKGEDLTLLSLKATRRGGRHWLDVEGWEETQRLAKLTPKLEFLQLDGVLGFPRIMEVLRNWPELKELHLLQEPAGVHVRRTLREAYPKLYVRIGETTQDPFEQYRCQFVRLEVLQEISMT